MTRPIDDSARVVAGAISTIGQAIAASASLPVAASAAFKMTPHEPANL